MMDATSPLATPAWREVAAMQDRRPARVTWVVAAVVAAVVAVAIGQRAAAAENTTREGWQLVVCEPHHDCETHGHALTSRTACMLDLGSEANVLPRGARLVCVKEQKR